MMAKLHREMIVTQQGPNVLVESIDLLDERDLMIVDREFEIKFENPKFHLLSVEFVEDGISDAGISEIRNLLFQARLSS